jgi:hypothetical protein
LRNGCPEKDPDTFSRVNNVSHPASAAHIMGDMSGA